MTSILVALFIWIYLYKCLGNCLHGENTNSFKQLEKITARVSFYCFPFSIKSLNLHVIIRTFLCSFNNISYSPLTFILWLLIWVLSSLYNIINIHHVIFLLFSDWKLHFKLTSFLLRKVQHFFISLHRAKDKEHYCRKREPQIPTTTLILPTTHSFVV